MAAGWAARSPPGPPTQLRCGEGSPRSSMVRAQPQQSGWRGSAGPYPQEGEPGPNAGHGHALAQPGPGQTGSKADRWSGGRAVCPPIQPTLQSGGQYPGLGWATLLGSCQVFRRKREGSRPSWKPTGVEAREGAEAGQLQPGRDPRGGREPRWGLPGDRVKNSRSARPSRRGAQCSQAPRASDRSRRAVWGPRPQPRRPRSQEH